MPVTITIKVKGAPNLKGLAEELKQPTEILQALQTFRRATFFAKIAAGVDASGNRVAPLSSRYSSYKLAKYGRRAIRVATGEMQASYDSEVIGNKMIESISDYKAIYHQKGTKKMPKRTLLVESWDELGGREQDQIKRLLKESLDKIITKFVRSL